MSKYVRVIMGARPKGQSTLAYSPIKETLSEGVTVTEAISACDTRFNRWLEGQYTTKEELLATSEFLVMQAAPWDVRI